MLKPVTRIIFIRNYEQVYSFDYVCEIECPTSWDLFTQTAKIEIPNSFRTKEIAETIINKIFIGDEIQIYTGYLRDGINKKKGNTFSRKFKGFVTKIKPGYVVKIECEDMMWKLKRTNIDGYHRYSPITLKQVILDLQKMTGLTFDTNIIDSSDIGEILVTPGNSFCDVLDFLKNKYLVLIWFRDGILYVRRPIQFVADSTMTVDAIFKDKYPVFIVQRNIINPDTLEYQREQDVRLVVKITNQIRQDGQNDKKTTYYVYYGTNGKIQNSSTPKVGYNQIEHIVIVGKTKAELIAEAEQILKSQTYTGYKGDFETFGEPVVHFGDFAWILDFKYPERTGRYLIRGVNYLFGRSGSRQRINIYGKG